MAVIDVYVIDDTRFDLPTILDKAFTSNDVGIKSIADMADKLATLCSNGDRIAMLTIVGHGNESGQSIGSDRLTLSSLPTHLPQLARMTPLFNHAGGAGKRAEVIMGGCRLGRNSPLLLALSKVWNVPVSGFTALQKGGLSHRGGRTTCYITCLHRGRTTADSVDEAEMRIREWVRRYLQ